MRMYGDLWRAVKQSSKDKPVKVKSHPSNHARIQQAISKLKSEENRARMFEDEPKIPHGRIKAWSEGGVLFVYLEFNGDNL